MSRFSKFLDEEKRIRNYLSTIERIFTLISKITYKKEKILLKLMYQHRQVLEKTKRPTHRLFPWFFKKSRESLLGQNATYINQYEFYLNQQLKLLAAEQQHEITEETTSAQLEHIASLPLFSKLKLSERELLQEISSKQTSSLHQILTDTIAVVSNLNKQKELLKTANLFQKELFEGRAINAKIEEEKKQLSEMNEIISTLNKIAREIITLNEKLQKEEERLAKNLNPHDIQLALQEIGIEVTNQKNKYHRIEEYLQEQRALRSKLEPKHLIAMHLTNYFPNQGVIQTSGKIRAMRDIKSAMPRETIHFALNGPVSSHMYGNWDSHKYAILIPVDKIIDRIINISPQDCFVVGTLNLPIGSEIIIQKTSDDKCKTFQENAGRAIVIMSNDGEKIRDAAQRRVRQRGYVAMSIGMWSWGGPTTEEDVQRLRDYWNLANEKDVSYHSSFNELAAKLNKEFDPHSHTLWYNIETVTWRAEHILTDLLDTATYVDDTGLIRKKKLVDSDTVDNIMRQLLTVRRDLGVKAREMKSKEEKKAIERIVQSIKVLYRALAAA